MARPLRIEYPGAYYHIMNRGNAAESIFPGREDKKKFLGYLGETVERFALVIHTYCLMSNHYHLLVETPLANLSSALQWLNVSYAVSYNRRHGRRGHLFGGRFKSLLVDAEGYLTLLSRYIHLNPVRARMVKRPQDYPWSSYRAFAGKVKPPDWLVTRKLLSYFAPIGGSDRKSSEREAIRGYREFVQDVEAEAVEDPTEQAAGGYILGGSDFVKWVQETFLGSRRDEREIPQLKALKPKVPLETIIQAVCREFDCGEKRVLEKGRKRNLARDVAIYMARNHTGESYVDLGKSFGGISGAGITRRCNVLEEKLARGKGLRKKMNTIEGRIVNS